MKFFSTAVAFSSIFLWVCFSTAIANHNSPAYLAARVATIGTLQIGEDIADINDSDTPAAPEYGETIYNTTCAACHTSGVAGAPVLGEADDWTERLEQGINMLTEHAIQGFSGLSGVMPAKGGNASLSNNAVTVAVQYMVDQLE